MNNPMPFCLAVMLISSFQMTAQHTKVVKGRKFKVNNLYMQGGLNSQLVLVGNLTDFKTLAPQSDLLKNNLNDYQATRSKHGISQSTFSISAGFQSTHKRKGNPLLRLGLSHTSTTHLNGSFIQHSLNASDTFNVSGEIYYTEQYTQKSFGMNYYSNQIRLDASVLFRTSPKARWSGYGGVGISAGMSYKAKTEIYSSKLDWTETHNSEGGSWQMNIDKLNHEYELIQSKNNFATAVYLPIGLDFRIGKTKSFWKMIHLFYEVRPGINMTIIPQVILLAQTNIQQGLGVRLAW